MVYYSVFFFILITLALCDSSDLELTRKRDLSHDLALHAKYHEMAKRNLKSKFPRRNLQPTELELQNPSTLSTLETIAASVPDTTDSDTVNKTANDEVTVRDTPNRITVNRFKRRGPNSTFDADFFEKNTLDDVGSVPNTELNPRETLGLSSSSVNRVTRNNTGNMLYAMVSSALLGDNLAEASTPILVSSQSKRSESSHSDITRLDSELASTSTLEEKSTNNGSILAVNVVSTTIDTISNSSERSENSNTTLRESNVATGSGSELGLELNIGKNILESGSKSLLRNGMTGQRILRNSNSSGVIFVPNDSSLGETRQISNVKEKGPDAELKVSEAMSPLDKGEESNKELFSVMAPTVVDEENVPSSERNKDSMNGNKSLEQPHAAIGSGYELGLGLNTPKDISVADSKSVLEAETTGQRIFNNVVPEVKYSSIDSSRGETLNSASIKDNTPQVEVTVPEPMSPLYESDLPNIELSSVIARNPINFNSENIPSTSRMADTHQASSLDTETLQTDKISSNYYENSEANSKLLINVKEHTDKIHNGDSPTDDIFPYDRYLHWKQRGLQLHVQGDITPLTNHSEESTTTSSRTQREKPRLPADLMGSSQGLPELLTRMELMREVLKRFSSTMRYEDSTTTVKSDAIETHTDEDKHAVPVDPDTTAIPVNAETTEMRVFTDATTQPDSTSIPDYMSLSNLKLDKVLNFSVNSQFGSECDMKIEILLNDAIDAELEENWERMFDSLNSALDKLLEAQIPSPEVTICDRSRLMMCDYSKSQAGATCQCASLTNTIDNKFQTAPREMRGYPKIRSRYCYSTGGSCDQDPAKIIPLFKEQMEKVRGHYGDPWKHWAETWFKQSNWCLPNLCVHLDSVKRKCKGIV